jgi:hypothetical protein
VRSIREGLELIADGASWFRTPASGRGQAWVVLGRIVSWIVLLGIPLVCMGEAVAALSGRVAFDGPSSSCTAQSAFVGIWLVIAPVRRPTVIAIGPGSPSNVGRDDAS